MAAGARGVREIRVLGQDREGSTATGLESTPVPLLPSNSRRSYGEILLKHSSSHSNLAWITTKAGEGDGARTRNLWIDKPVETDWLW